MQNRDEHKLKTTLNRIKKIRDSTAQTATAFCRQPMMKSICVTGRYTKWQWLAIPNDSQVCRGEGSRLFKTSRFQENGHSDSHEGARKWRLVWAFSEQWYFHGREMKMWEMTSLLNYEICFPYKDWKLNNDTWENTALFGDLRTRRKPVKSAPFSSAWV